MIRRCLFALTLAALVAGGLAGCAPSDLAPYTFAASYRFMGSPADYSVAPDCAAYAELEVRDGRTEGNVVGVRYLEEGGSRYDVMLDGDVEAWLRQAAEQALAEAGVRRDAGSGHTVTVTLERIATDESVYRRAEYDATVQISTAVSGGGADWSGNQKGFAENYGYAGSAENYQETVNHALDRALADAMNDSGFTEALCK